MKFSKIGIFVLVSLVAVLMSSCSFYYRVMSRKSLVDGAKAYNERKFEEAENLFRRAVGFDENLATFEGKMAQLFLARTLHSEYAGDRDQKDTAEKAIGEYKKTLAGFVADVAEKRAALANSPDDEALKNELEGSEKTVGSIVSAVASLHQNLDQNDKWLEWQTAQAKSAEIPNVARANAYIAMGAKQYSCANDISDDEAVKSTVEKDGEASFVFKKPESEDDFKKLKECVEKGSDYIDNAIKLNAESDSAWSYKTSLLVQQARIAEMEGDTESKDKFKEESDEAKKKFDELAKKRREAEEAALKKAAEEAAKKAGDKATEETKEGEGDSK